MPIRIIEPAEVAEAEAAERIGRVRIIEAAAPPKKDRARAAAERDATKRIKSAPGQVRALTKGFSFGFADDVDALGAAAETGAGNLFKRATGQPVEYGMKDAYGAVMGANAKADNLFAREHPVQNVGLQVAGGAAGPGMAAGARYIGGATSLARAAGRSALVGAGAGAAAGAGNARGDLGERAAGAARGAIEGAVIGGAVPVAARAAQTGGRALNAAIGQPFGGAQRGAAARLREALQQDGLTPAQVAQAVQRWEQSGVTPEFLNVVGENTRALIRAAGGQGGGARNAAQQYRERTVSGIPNQAIERANALTPGETRTPGQFAEGMTTQRAASAQQNYGQWRNTPVEVPAAVQDMLRDPSGRAIIARARADAVELGDFGMQAELEALLQPARNGQLPRVSAGTVDRLSTAARERGATMAQRGARARSAGAMQRREQLDSVLGGIPEVQPSRGQYRDQSRAIEAAQEGPSVMGPRSEFQPAQEAIAQNPEAVRGAQIRERQALRDHFGTRDQVRGRLADIAQAPDVRPNLQQLYGAEGERFADAAGNLVQKQDHANFIAPNTGSQTQTRGNDQRNVFGAVRSMMEVAGGSLRPILERMARGLTMTERERQALVDLGISNPADALRALQAPAPMPSQIGGNLFRRAAVTAAPAAVSQTAGN